MQCTVHCFKQESSAFGIRSEQEPASDAALPVMHARGAAAGDALALEDYFQKPIALSDLSDHWASRDQRFRQVAFSSIPQPPPGLPSHTTTSPAGPMALSSGIAFVVLSQSATP